MKHVKKILFAAAIFAAIWVVAPFFFPETMVVSRSILLDVPARTLFAKINDFRNWEFWSPWQPDKEQTQAIFQNNGFGRGGVAIWPSDISDSPLQKFTITNAEPYTIIEVAMDFPGKAFSVNRIVFSENEGQTGLTWSMGVKTEGWKTLFFRIKAAKYINRALSDLSTTALLWHRRGLPIAEAGIINAFPYVSIRRQIAWEELSEAMEKMYEVLISSADEGNYQIIGHPYAIYHSMGEDRVDIECGFPVDKQPEHSGIINSGIYSEVMCAITEYTGSYENLETGHTAVQEWMSEREFTLSGPPMEIYMTNESESDNPDEWKTKICYPISK
jgi:effector-binding domain-containing protein